MRRICFKKGDVVARFKKLKDWFSERGYLKDMVNKQRNRAIKISLLSRYKTGKKSVTDNGQTERSLGVTTIIFLVVEGNLYVKIFIFYSKMKKLNKSSPLNPLFHCVVLEHLAAT